MSEPNEGTTKGTNPLQGIFADHYNETNPVPSMNDSETAQIFQTEKIFNQEERIANAEQALSMVDDHSSQAREMAKLQNAQYFAKMYNITEYEAMRMHDVIVQGAFPGDKASPESVLGMMREAAKESWEIEKLNYVSGLIGAGDESQELWDEYKRLREVTENGEKINRLMTNMNERDWGFLKKTLVEGAGQAPQLFGRGAEILKLMYDDASYGYYQRETDGSRINEDRTLGGKILKETLSAAGRPLTAGMRYTHVTHSGQMYRQLWDELEQEGIELTEDQEKAIRYEIKGISNMYSALTQADTLADIAFTYAGGKIAKEAVEKIGKGVASLAMNSIKNQVKNIGASATSEYGQGLISGIGQETIRELAGLRDSGGITGEEFMKVSAVALEGAALAGRITLLTGGASTTAGAIVGGTKVMKNFNYAEFTKEAKDAMHYKQETESAFKSSLAAGVFNDIDAEGSPAIAQAQKTMAESGILKSSEVRRAYKEFITNASNATRGESMRSLYQTYTSLMHASLRANNVERPAGVYSNELSMYRNFSDGEYPGRLDMSYVQGEAGGQIKVDFNGTPQIKGATFNVSQAAGAGIIFDPVTDLELGEQHPLRLRINEAMEDFRVTNMKEGSNYDLNELNLPDEVKAVLEKAENPMTYVYNLMMKDVEEAKHEIYTRPGDEGLNTQAPQTDTAEYQAKIDRLANEENEVALDYKDAAAELDAVNANIETFKETTGVDTLPDDNILMQNQRDLQERIDNLDVQISEIQESQVYADATLNLADENNKMLAEVFEVGTDMEKLSVILDRLPSSSTEAAAIRQAMYRMESEKLIHVAAKTSFERMSSKINRSLDRTDIPNATANHIEHLLLNVYNVWDSTERETARYHKLPPERSKWTEEEALLSKKVEADSFDSLTLEEMADLTDRIEQSLYAAERIMDFQHMGVTLTPDQAVHMGQEEIKTYNNKQMESEAELLDRTNEGIFKRKIEQGKSLAMSLDNRIASVAGSFGVVYDALAYQIRESGHEAKRQMYQSVADYNASLLTELRKVDGEITNSNFTAKTAKWGRTKHNIAGVKLSNEELLTLYIHDSLPQNKTHLVNGIFKENYRGGKTRIKPEVVLQAIEMAKMDPYSAAIYTAMKPTLEALRRSQELTLQTITGDKNKIFGYRNGYFPIEINEHGFDTDWVPRDDKGREMISTNKQNLKERTSKPEAMINLKPAFSVFQGTIEKASRFSNQEISFWRASKIMQDTDFKETMINNTSLETWEAIWKGLEDSAGLDKSWQSEAHVGKTMRKLMAGRSIASLGFNLVSAGRAWSSTFGMMAYIDADIATEAITKHQTVDGMSPRAFARSMSALYNARVKNGLYPEFMNGADTDFGFHSNKMKDVAFIPMKYVDADAAARAWMGGYLQVMKDIEAGTPSDFTRKATMIDSNALKKLTPEKKVQLAIQAGDFLMNMSQPSTETYTRSGLQRAGTIGAMMTQFGSSVNAMRQQAIYAGQIAKSTNLTSEQKAQKISMVATGLALQAAAYVGIGLLGSLAYGQLQGEDGADKAKRKATADFLNTFGAAFGIGRIISVRLQETSKKDQRAGDGPYRFKLGINTLPIPVLDASDGQSLMNSLDKIMQSWEGKKYDDGELNGEYINMISILSTNAAPFTPLGGLPTGAIKKGIEAFDNWTDND